jgi:hypothetical protein
VNSSIGRLRRDLVPQNKIIGREAGGINHPPTLPKIGLEIVNIFGEVF